MSNCGKGWMVARWATKFVPQHRSRGSILHPLKMADDFIEAEPLPPEPEVTGVDPAQQPAAVDADAILGSLDRPAAGGIRTISVSATLQSLRHGVTGIAATSLLHVSTAKMEREVAEAKGERDEARKAASEFKDKWHEEHTRVAVLSSKLTGAKEVKVLRSVLLTVGGIIAGSAGATPWMIAGVALLLVGWFWPSGRESNS